MLSKLNSRRARRLARWCAYGLVLVAPGSFVVVPLWLLGRRLASRDARPRMEADRP